MDVSSFLDQVAKAIEEVRDFVYGENNDDGTVTEYRVGTLVVDVKNINRKIVVEYKVGTLAINVKDSDEEILKSLFFFVTVRLGSRLIKDSPPSVVPNVRSLVISPRLSMSTMPVSDLIGKALQLHGLSRKTVGEPLHTLLTEEQKKRLLEAIRKARVRELKQMLINGAMFANYFANYLVKWHRILRRKTKIPSIAPWQFMSSAHYKRYIVLRHLMKRYRGKIKYYFSQSYHVYLADLPRFYGFFVIGKDDSGKYFCDAIESMPKAVRDFASRHKQFFVDDKVVKEEIFGYSEELRDRVLRVNPKGYRVQGDLKLRVLDAETVDIRLLRDGAIVEYMVKEMAKRHDDVRKRIETDMIFGIDREFFGSSTRVLDVISYIEKKYKLEALMLMERRLRLVYGIEFGNEHVVVVERGVPIARKGSSMVDVLTLHRTRVVIRHNEHGVLRLLVPAHVVLRFYLNKFFDLGLERD